MTVDVIARSDREPRTGRRLPGLVAALVALLVLAATPSPAGATPQHRARSISVATYNLYLGADLKPLFAAGSDADPTALAAEVHRAMRDTNFPERAEVIAREIAEQAPDLIGLQEVALWHTASIDQPGVPHTVDDFLTILLDELREQGVHYRAVATNTNFSAALPISDTLIGSFTDRDVILARADEGVHRIKVRSATSHTFAATLPLVAAGRAIKVPRGWSSVDVKHRGRAYRFVNTHLEAFSADVRGLQAQELATWIAASPIPVVLVGDLNSARGATADAYGTLAAAGLQDAWVAAMSDDPGHTAGQSADLKNPTSQLDHTVDYVFHDAHTFATIPGSEHLLGEEPEDRTAGGLWPSDHAGVAVSLRVVHR